MMPREFPWRRLLPGTPCVFLQGSQGSLAALDLAMMLGKQPTEVGKFHQQILAPIGNGT